MMGTTSELHAYCGKFTVIYPLGIFTPRLSQNSAEPTDISERFNGIRSALSTVTSLLMLRAQNFYFGTFRNLVREAAIEV